MWGAQEKWRARSTTTTFMFRLKPAMRSVPCQLNMSLLRIWQWLTARVQKGRGSKHMQLMHQNLVLTAQLALVWDTFMLKAAKGASIQNWGDCAKQLNPSILQYAKPILLLKCGICLPGVFISMKSSRTNLLNRCYLIAQLIGRIFIRPTFSPDEHLQHPPDQWEAAWCHALLFVFVITGLLRINRVCCPWFHVSQSLPTLHIQRSEGTFVPIKITAMVTECTDKH